MTVGDIVYDRWWPWRVGRVMKVLKTRTHVRWTDGEVWNYDRPHARFLDVLRPKAGDRRPSRVSQHRGRLRP